MVGIQIILGLLHHHKPQPKEDGDGGNEAQRRL
jgi:hypothetical protein